MSAVCDEIQLALELNEDVKHELLSATDTVLDYDGNHNVGINNIDTDDSCLELRWQSISYHTKGSGSLRLPFGGLNQQKALISNLSGCFRSGQLAAIIGPSGAGKTTFLTCLAGRRAKGLSGSITVGYRGVPKSDIKISYYSQKDALYERLTADEAIEFAFRLRKCQTNSTRTTRDSLYALRKELNLLACGNTRVQTLSGGEKRRLSIALELIFSPNILLLDEPTSGLDSLSTLQCVTMLKKLVNGSSTTGPMIVATSIHQPTAKLLAYFDHLYIISHNGKCIYDASPSDLVTRLSSIGLQCPEYHNPSDFMIEVASGEFGDKSIDMLAELVLSNSANEHNQDIHLNTKEIRIEKVTRKRQGSKQSWWNEIKTIEILTEQAFKLNARDPHAYFSRVVIFGATLLLVWLLYHKEPIGQANGCVHIPSRHWLQVLSNMDFAKEASSFYDNFGFLFYSVVIVVFMAILPVLLSFPLEVSVFIKENFNGWYSLRAYYIARNISELPPTLVFPVVYASVSYYITGQPLVVHRFLLYNFILVLTTILAQGLGFVVAAYYVNNVPQSTLVGGTVNIPLFMFTGLLIKIHSMPTWIYPFTFISYLRLSFESLLVTIYGLGRCPSVQPIRLGYLKQEFGDTVLDMYDCMHNFDETGLVKNFSSLVDVYNNKYITSAQAHEYSYTLNIFDYNDQTLYQNIVAMILYMILLRFAGFWILRWQTSVK